MSKMFGMAETLVFESNVDQATTKIVHTYHCFCPVRAGHCCRVLWSWCLLFLGGTVPCRIGPTCMMVHTLEWWGEVRGWRGGGGSCA